MTHSSGYLYIYSESRVLMKRRLLVSLSTTTIVIDLVSAHIHTLSHSTADMHTRSLAYVYPPLPIPLLLPSSPLLRYMALSLTPYVALFTPAQ